MKTVLEYESGPYLNYAFDHKLPPETYRFMEATDSSIRKSIHVLALSILLAVLSVFVGHKLLAVTILGVNIEPMVVAGTQAYRAQKLIQQVQTPHIHLI